MQPIPLQNLPNQNPPLAHQTPLGNLQGRDVIILGPMTIPYPVAVHLLRGSIILMASGALIGAPGLTVLMSCQHTHCQNKIRMISEGGFYAGLIFFIAGIVGLVGFYAISANGTLRQRNPLGT